MSVVALVILVLCPPPADRPAVAGEYVAGTSASSAVVLQIRESGEFVYRAGAGLQPAASATGPTEYRGRWVWDADTIQLEPVYDEEREDYPKMPVRWVPIPWGRRLYLVPEGRLIDFCNAVNLGQEPRIELVGDLPLRRGDWRLPAPGGPSLPQDWRRFILAEPIVGWVTDVGDDGFARVKVLNGDDLQAGMLLVAYDDKGERRRPCRLKVLCPCEGNAKVVIMCPDDVNDRHTYGNDLQPADRVTTSGKIPPASVPPSLKFVEEMAPLPAKFDKPAPTLSKEQRERFRQEWQALAPRLVKAVTAASLADISRWAKEQTAGTSLPPRWPAKLPLKPTGCDAGGKVLFTHSVADGIKLPSHQPIVHRRLVIAAVYDVSAGMIETVYVTIKGWAEE